MKKFYKLTDADMRTYKGTSQWKLGALKKATEGPLKPCSEFSLHAYSSPKLAALFDPIHGNYGPDARLFECKFSGEVDTDGLKVWGKEQTLTKEIPLPVFTDRQRVLFAIRATRLVLKPGVIPEWDQWADDFINGIDDQKAARVAHTASVNAARNIAFDNAAEAAVVTVARTIPTAADITPPVTAVAAYAAARAARAVDNAYANYAAAHSTTAVTDTDAHADKFTFLEKLQEIADNL